MTALSSFHLWVAILVAHFAETDCTSTAYFSRSTVTSSSELSPKYSASNAALSSSTAWCPRQNFTNDEYLQLDFGNVKLIKEIEIAGEGSPPANQTARNVTKYLIRVSTDGATYEDFEPVSQLVASLQIRTRYIRIVPLEFADFPCMRIELYGCKARSPELCSDDNGGCSQRCIQHSKYCFLGKCFFDCHIDFLCKKWVECECNTGYKLLGDKRNCADINECDINNGNCDQICNNTQGSYECKCGNGFALNSDKHKCNDVNECDNNNGGCNQRCINTFGSYHCSCQDGFQLSSDNHTCNDIDECALHNGGCSNGCLNLQGSYICTCPQGFELDQTNKNCKDKNECLLANGGCHNRCHNTNGSYYCSCPSGFELYEKFTCRDIDECATQTDNCSTLSTKCSNFQGGYECQCKSGYEFIQGDDFNCELIACPPLVEATGTSVTPRNCLVVDGRNVNDTCTFSCNEGYKLPDPNQPTLTCLDTGYWDKAIISCQRETCPALPSITNGLITPSFCAVSGYFFGENCQYTCNSGYTLTGKSLWTCQANGTWDITSIPTCDKVYPKPWITCPSDVVVDLAPNEKEYDATALIEQPQSNVQNVQMYPEKYRNNLVFPYGSTALTYVAKNGAGDTANCTTDIIVQDKQAPTIVYCPEDIYQAISGSGAKVTWSEPQFTDNVKVERVTSTKKSGDYFQLGSTLVKYDAFDQSGRSVSCTFTVKLTAKKCVIPEDPDNGKLSCADFGSTIFCSIDCDRNNQTFQYTFGLSCTSLTLTWPPIPDCVDAVVRPDSGVCPEGKINQTSLTNFENPIKYCVNCPRGMKYDSASKDCVACPVGYISRQESSPDCTKCPPKTSTPTKGSKVCTDLCDKGQSSQDGFDNPNHDICTLCSLGFYQDQYGATQCKQCPSGLTTLAKGSTSLADCGTMPSISSFGPPSMAVNVTENERAELVCMGDGPPTPTFLVKKTTPLPDGFGGPVEVDYLYSGNAVTGIRYIILSTTEHDAGRYSCTVTNKFGSYTKYLNLYVHWYFGGGESGSGAGK